ALLVPFAAATDEHQRRNAEAMQAAGAAEVLLETDLEIPGKLLETLTGLLGAPERLATMAQEAKAQSHPGAAERIAGRLAEMASGISAPPA
ncbi:MAG: glycosyltransferase, partial [Terracidiphilus sp.]